MTPIVYLKKTFGCWNKVWSACYIYILNLNLWFLYFQLTLLFFMSYLHIFLEVGEVRIKTEWAATYLTWTRADFSYLYTAAISCLWVLYHVFLCRKGIFWKMISKNVDLNWCLKHQIQTSRTDKTASNKRILNQKNNIFKIYFRTYSIRF